MDNLKKLFIDFYTEIENDYKNNDGKVSINNKAKVFAGKSKDSKFSFDFWYNTGLDKLESLKKGTVKNMF